jgi:xylulokinase
MIEFDQGFGMSVIGDPPRVGHPMVILDHLRPTGEIQIESILSYVAGSLCDQAEKVIHVTDAAALGLCNIRRGTWSTHGLRFLGISEGQIPTIVDELVSVGNSIKGIPLNCGIGDQQSSLFGVGLEKHEVSVNLATGCQVSRIEDSPRSEIQTRPYFFGDFLQTITHLPAGRLLSSAVSRCGFDIHEANSWQVAEEMSRSERSSEVKNACEQIAMSICSAIDRIRSQSVSNIVFSGGVAQKFPAIRRIVESKTRMDSRVFDGDDAALAGLRRLSQIA